MIYLYGRGGLGDAVYARPFVKAALASDQVLVETSWPWVFSDLPARPVKRIGGLRVQAYHGELVPDDVWSERPAAARGISIRYRWSQLAKQVSVTHEMELQSKLKPDLTLDLPPTQRPRSPSGNYMVIRPPAIRCDFPAPAREPDPAYLRAAADLAMSAGMRVVSVGAWIPGLEEPNGTINATDRYENGELSLPELFGLVQHATLVVCAPCWMIPACLATRTPLIVIAGGCGGRNNRNALIDRRQDTGRVRWLQPDNYCMCRKRHHGCPKFISGFPGRLTAMMNDLIGVATW